MDGVLLIDKPAGPTSHDVVARTRRTLDERRIGHTGTLDPRATGLLALVVGRATRLAGLLTGGKKTYEATICLGWATDTDDAEGQPLGPPATDTPTDKEIDEALDAFRGTFAQRPPIHSAKKVGGRKAYDLARKQQPVELQPVEVTVSGLERLAGDGRHVSLRIEASSGFYVRALARDFGQRLGCGGHLEALRRTRSEPFAVSDALPLADAERLGPALASRLISPADALPSLPAVEVTAAGLKRAVHGNQLGPEHLTNHWIPPASSPDPVRVLDIDGRLVALARSRGGALHPVVVLG